MTFFLLLLFCSNQFAQKIRAPVYSGYANLNTTTEDNLCLDLLEYPLVFKKECKQKSFVFKLSSNSPMNGFIKSDTGCLFVDQNLRISIVKIGSSEKDSDCSEFVISNNKIFYELNGRSLSLAKNNDGTAYFSNRPSRTVYFKHIHKISYPKLITTLYYFKEENLTLRINLKTVRQPSDVELFVKDTKNNVFETKIVSNLVDTEDVNIRTNITLTYINKVDKSKSLDLIFIGIPCFERYEKCEHGKPVFCKPNEIYDANKDDCVCRKHFAKNKNGECELEPKNCGANEAFDIASYSCVCKKNYVRNAKAECELVPKTCVANETFDPVTKNCVCLKNYVRNAKGECELIPKTCGANEKVDIATNTCVCLKNYVKNAKGQCELIPKTCGANEKVDIATNTCVCLKNYARNAKGQCEPVPKTCGANEVYDSNTNSCICDQKYARSNSGKCVLIAFTICHKNEILDSKTNSCVCMPNYKRKPNGNCEQDIKSNCQSNEIFDINSNTCVCKPNYARSTKGNCEPVQNKICGTNETLDTIKRSCVCQKNYVRNANGKCYLGCQKNEEFDSSKNACKCKKNYILSSKGVCRWDTSVCQVGLYYVKGYCLPCPVNTFYDDGKCYRCSEGTFSVGGAHACKNILFMDRKWILIAYCSTLSVLLIAGSLLLCFSKTDKSITKEMNDQDALLGPDFDSSLVEEAAEIHLIKT